jgi:hypothetical protein
VIKAYLDRPETRELLGVESPNNFSACSRDVGAGFAAHLDKWGTFNYPLARARVADKSNPHAAVPTQYYVAGLLERGIRVLIYAGTYDWQCNWVANARWVDKLEWSGRDEYAAQGWRDWTVSGRKAGETKSAAAGQLTFATVRGAGHMGERPIPYRHQRQPSGSDPLRWAIARPGLAWEESVGRLIDLFSQCRTTSRQRHARWCRGGLPTQICEVISRAEAACLLAVAFGGCVCVGASRSSSGLPARGDVAMHVVAVPTVLLHHVSEMLRDSCSLP